MSAALEGGVLPGAAPAGAVRPAGGSAPLLVVERVAKRFRRGPPELPVLREVSLALTGGEVLALVGENGAGKTTLLRTIAGLIEPDQGEVRVLGRALGSQGQREIGWCSSDERSFYPRLSGSENLMLFAALHGLDRAAARARVASLAERFGLGSALGKPFQTCSTGQRQRLNLVRALLHEPRLLLLDEPARSLDLATRAILIEVLREHVADGERAAIVAGHDFAGFEAVCDSIAVLHQGRLHGPAPVSRAAVAGTSVWELAFRSRTARDAALVRSSTLRAGAAPELAEHETPHADLSPELRACLAATGAELVRLERREGSRLGSLVARAARGELDGIVAAKSGSPRRDGASADRAGSARPATGRPRLGIWRVLAALARRDRLVYLSHRFQTGLKIGVLLVWILTLYHVSDLVDASAPGAAELFSSDYFTYALLGLACMRISQVCLVQMAGVLREEQLQGTIEPLIATGRSPLLLILGGLGWPLVSDFAGMLVVFAASAWLLGAGLASANLPALFAALCATVAASAVLGVLSATCVLAFKRGDPVTLFFNVVSVGISGVFFPVEHIPAWLQPLSRALPLTHGLEAVRAAALRGAGFTSPDYLRALAGLGLLSCILVPLAAVAFRAALAHARRSGSLAQS